MTDPILNLSGSEGDRGKTEPRPSLRIWRAIVILLGCIALPCFVFSVAVLFARDYREVAVTAVPAGHRYVVMNGNPNAVVRCQSVASWLTGTHDNFCRPVVRRDALLSPAYLVGGCLAAGLAEAARRHRRRLKSDWLAGRQPGTPAPAAP